MSRNLARFKGGALALRPTTSWAKPKMGGRIRGAYTGLKRRAKNLLARPGIQKAMNRVGGAAGNASGWVKQKTGFSRSYELAEFRRRRLGRSRGRRRKLTASGHVGKGAAYGALTGGTAGAALGGAGTYHAARKMGASRSAAIGAGIVGGALGAAQGTLSGAMTGGTLGLTAYGARKIRRGE